MFAITHLRILSVVLFIFGASAKGQPSFVNWESPHIHPLEGTPDALTLLAVNTPDNRLEILDVTAQGLVPVGSVTVGLDPVSVRARTNTEAWVVNHISDSVSVVDLNTMNVVATIRTDDEPADVIFAGNPLRAYVTCSQSNTVLVIDPDAPLAPIVDLTPALQAQFTNGPPPGLNVRIPIIGEEPRSLAVSTDGTEVYVGIFRSGNGTTILPGGEQNPGSFGISDVVNSIFSPYFDPGEPFAIGSNPPNPPPNNGSGFFPPIAAQLPTPPRVGLIVRLLDGAWLDDNGQDWTHVVSGVNAAESGRPMGWDLLDPDVGVIDAGTLAVHFIGGLMNTCMNVSINPGTGDVTVLGTDATNEVRFEPNLNGRFLRVLMGIVSPDGLGGSEVLDLNPHLNYSNEVPFQPVPQSVRDNSIGDPRGIVWTPDGAIAYLSGMGSNNAAMFEANAEPNVIFPFEVGEGPTGLVLDSPRFRLYVLNKFESTISTVNIISLTESLPRVPLYDPTPDSVRAGRKHLYDTHRNSGLGHQSCASCHIDARTDGLAWDLGNPQGNVKPFDQNCDALPGAACDDWHPMKGPMTTQTLVDIIGKEPHQWRGDLNGLEEFAAAFETILGDDVPLPPGEMQELEDFLASIHFPPNPRRNFDNTLPTDVSLEGHYSTGRFFPTGGLPAGEPLPNGDAVAGLAVFRRPDMDGALACVSCHTLPAGMGPDGVFVDGQFEMLTPGPLGEHHLSTVSSSGSTNRTMKIPQLRNAYEKTGFDTTQMENTSGFGLLHDGSMDSLARFASVPTFSVASDQEVADLVAFLLSFGGSNLPAGNPADPLEPPGPPSRDTHAAVGWQVTITNSPPQAADLDLITDMMILADAGAVGVVAKGVLGGITRGYTYVGGDLYQSDRAAETETSSTLIDQAAPGNELTFTVVPVGSEIRIGIDRDEDGILDRDEVDGCSDPADPASVPPQCPIACGGTEGLTCPMGLFCKLPLAQCCCEVEGVCKPIPFVCPPTAGTVCGCDGRTYINECLAEKARTSVLQHGSCGDEPGMPLVEDSLQLTCVDDLDCPGLSRCIDTVCYVPRNRYLAYDPNHGNVSTAFEIALVSSDAFPGHAGNLGWIGTPDENGVSFIVDEPVFWRPQAATVHVADCGIVPASMYEISATLDGLNFTNALSMPTVPAPAPKHWADVVANFAGGSWGPPNGVINIDDALAVIQGFQDFPTAAPISWLDIHDQVPNRLVNIADVQQAILAFQGEEYPYDSPLLCP